MKALGSVLESVRTTRSRTAKEQFLADYLSTLDPVSLGHAARMLSGRVFPVDDRRSPRAGWSVWREAAAAATGWDVETVTESMRAVSDAGEAIGLLVAANPDATAREGISLSDVVALSERLAASNLPARKVALLAEALRKCTPLEAKYLVKLLSGGMRVGAQQGVMEGAMARAFSQPVDSVRRALARTADVGEVALLARDGALDGANVQLGRPIGFMLATPVQNIVTIPSGIEWIAEDKLDGIRAQVHKRAGDVRLFARSGDPLDGAYPEIEDAIRWTGGSYVLDGEIIALASDGSIAPFALLQERINRKAPGARERRRLPVMYVAFDLLADSDDHRVLDQPWSERRARLDALAAEHFGDSDRLRTLPYRPLGEQPLEDLRREALERGAEGLVLKRRDSPYEAGRRGQSWIKVKEAYATLDVVITSAEEGHGKRRGMLSDYTFAVWQGSELVNIGKAYSGLTDEEIEALTTRLTRMTIARYGRQRAVKPEIVLEIAFDGINRSLRHKSGFALRFPRIVRVRDDKSAAQANTVTDVEALFARQGTTRARLD